MKNKLVIITSWLLVLLTMIIIFNFSGQSATQSSQVSEGVVVEILGIVMDKEEITPPVIQKFQFPIRKLAHFGIYMLLGFCMMNAFFNTVKLKQWLNLSFSSVACILYAVFDEAHQSFSEGRGPGVLDVVIDSCGSVVGIALFMLFILIYKRILTKKSRTQKACPS